MTAFAAYCILSDGLGRLKCWEPESFRYRPVEARNVFLSAAAKGDYDRRFE